MYVSVPCGKCVACKKRRATHWSFRLNEEAKLSSSASFLTLTYEKTPISKNGFQTLVKRDFQLFLKRLRKTCPTKKRKIVLSHCVACHQQLDLLQLRLINFDDLIIGVQDTITLTTKQLNDLKQDKPSPTLAFEPAGEPTKLKKV
jgi:hypothetical protein